MLLGEEKQFLASAKKETLKYYSNFILSNHPKHIHTRSEYYLGRLESNFVGTEFKLYFHKQQMESLALVVNYHKNIAGFMGPRAFTAIKVNPEAKVSPYSESLSTLFERN